jgi:hypothetical protein
MRRDAEPVGSAAGEWAGLNEATQLRLSREALLRAAETIAGQAEILAGEMERGGVADHGGPEALRLLAAVIRLNGLELVEPVGNA